MEPNIDPVLPVEAIPPQPLPTSYASQKSFPWLISIFSLLLTATLVAAGFFFFQTQSLKKQLTNTAPASPTSTPQASATVEDNILSIIPQLTAPMTWSAPAAGTLQGVSDNVDGTLIVANKIATKSDNKFAPLLVSDSILISDYGWTLALDESADGMGESLTTFKKGTQKLIIRYQGGVYKVLFVDKPTSTTSIPANWQHTILKDNKSSVDYPRDWKLTDNTKQVDFYNDGILQWQQDIIIKKDGYTLESMNPLAWGPNACLFPDSPDYDKDQAFGEKYGDYTEFSNSQVVYRRVKLPQIPTQPPIARFGICTSKSGPAGFGMVAGYGSTTYTAPLNFDESILKIMDNILLSI